MPENAIGANRLSPSDLAAHGAETIAKGSTSFAMASLLFGKRMQADVQMLYAWCRHCDDIIDGQTLGRDGPDIALDDEELRQRLSFLKRDTVRALNGEDVGHPAFDGFSLVARKHPMPVRYPMDLLDGFAMDVARKRYRTLEDTLGYCYGVAGAVGVMMAIVMGAPHDDEATLDRACDLGLAFQLTNICRDVIDDAKAGRVYLPATWLEQEGVDPDPVCVQSLENRAAVAKVCARMLDEADRYYRSAGCGVRRLPVRAAAAVAAARNVYRDIGRMVRSHGADAWNERRFTSSSRKAWLGLTGVLAGAPASMFLRRSASTPRPDDLWTRPVQPV